MLEFLRSWQRERGRVMIFSGVFDPVHKGHIAIAKKVLESQGSAVIFLPEKNPQRTIVGKVIKSIKPRCSPYNQRLTMLAIATKPEPRFSVVESPYDHHSVRQTLGWIKSQFPEDQNFGLLFGADVAEYFWQWPDVEVLNEYGVDRVIFANRATDSVFSLDRHIKPIAGVKVATMNAENDHLSSTLIRQNVKNRQGALPEGVYEYILENRLYDSEDSSSKK